MKKLVTLLLYCILTLSVLTCFVQADGEPDKLAKVDQHALAIGRAVLRLNELGGAGKPLMTNAQKSEFERNVKFLSGTESGRMTWAWLEFRLKADRQLRLEDNSSADAIRQRLDLFTILVRKYFVLE